MINGKWYWKSAAWRQVRGKATDQEGEEDPILYSSSQPCHRLVGSTPSLRFNNGVLAQIRPLIDPKKVMGGRNPNALPGNGFQAYQWVPGDPSYRLAVVGGFVPRQGVREGGLKWLPVAPRLGAADWDIERFDIEGACPCSCFCCCVARAG
jgi:hypothetical protein